MKVGAEPWATFPITPAERLPTSTPPEAIASSKAFLLLSNSPFSAAVKSFAEFISFLFSAKYLRQTLVFAAYETPEMRRLFNGALANVAGKRKTRSRWDPVEVPDGVKQVSAMVDSKTTLHG